MTVVISCLIHEAVADGVGLPDDLFAGQTERQSRFIQQRIVQLGIDGNYTIVQENSRRRVTIHSGSRAALLQILFMHAVYDMALSFIQQMTIISYFFGSNWHWRNLPLFNSLPFQTGPLNRMSQDRINAWFEGK